MKTFPEYFSCEGSIPPPLALLRPGNMNHLFRPYLYYHALPVMFDSCLFTDLNATQHQPLQKRVYQLPRSVRKCVTQKPAFFQLLIICILQKGAKIRKGIWVVQVWQRDHKRKEVASQMDLKDGWDFIWWIQRTEAFKHRDKIREWLERTHDATQRLNTRWGDRAWSQRQINQLK